MVKTDNGEIFYLSYISQIMEKGCHRPFDTEINKFGSEHEARKKLADLNSENGHQFKNSICELILKQWIFRNYVTSRTVNLNGCDIFSVSNSLKDSINTLVFYFSLPDHLYKTVRAYQVVRHVFLSDLDHNEWIEPCKQYTEDKIVPYIIGIFTELFASYKFPVKYINHAFTIAEDVEYVAHNSSSSFGLLSIAYLYMENANSMNYENLRKIHRHVRDIIYRT